MLHQLMSVDGHICGAPPLDFGCQSFLYLEMGKIGPHWQASRQPDPAPSSRNWMSRKLSRQLFKLPSQRHIAIGKQIVRVFIVRLCNWGKLFLYTSKYETNLLDIKKDSPLRNLPLFYCGFVVWSNFSGGTKALWRTPSVLLWRCHRRSYPYLLFFNFSHTVRHHPSGPPRTGTVLETFFVVALLS